MSGPTLTVTIQDTDGGSVNNADLTTLIADLAALTARMDALTVDTVVDLPTSPTANQVVRTLRYSSSHAIGGDSGNVYVWKSGDSSTVDGGFVLNGTGGRWHALDKTRARLPQFGGIDYVTDPSADNTSVIAQMMKIRSNSNSVKIEIPPGTWRVSTGEIYAQLSAGEQQTNKAFLLSGNRPENELQGTNEFGFTASSVILLDWDDEAQWFLERLAAGASTRFGMCVVENLVFKADRDKRVSGFSVGATTSYGATLGTGAAFRGLIIRHCRFDQQAHWWDYSYGTPQEELYDAGDPGEYIKHRRRNDTWLRTDHAYSVWIENNCFRGAARHIDMDGDLVTIRGNQFILGGHAIVNSGVTMATIEDQTIEDVGIAGLCVNKARVINCNIEVGYDNVHGIKLDDGDANSADFTLTGLYDQEGTTWSIDRDATRIEFDNLGSEDMRDHLTADSIIEVTPTTSGQPARCFLIESVDATGATLRYTGLNSGTANPCNVPKDIAGIASGIRRIYYLPAIFYGQAVEVANCRFEINQARADLPLFAVVPERDWIQIRNISKGSSLSHAAPLMVYHHLGGPALNTGGVIMDSAYHQIEEWDHPRAFRSHRMPYGENNGFSGWWVYDTDFQYKIRPGCGVRANTDRASDELLFRRATVVDTEHPRAAVDSTYLPWVYKLTDLVTQPYLKLTFPGLTDASDWAGVQFSIRLWSDTAYSGSNSNRLRIYTAAGGANDWIYYDVANTGWQTINVTMPAGATYCWLPYNTATAAPMNALIQWIGYNP